MRLNGTVDIAALIWSLLKRPRDLPTLMRLALDARAARATLLRGRKLLDSSLCMGDFIAPGPQDRRPVAARAEPNSFCGPAPADWNSIGAGMFLARRP
jgi:hypothetical protein